MRQIELQADQALAQGLQLPYAMIRSYSQVTMGNTPPSVDLTEVIEARFFNAETEVRLFRKDGKLCGAKLCGECGDIGTEESFRIENPEFGSELKVYRHLASDEDGQTYVMTTRLCGWTGR